MRLATTLLLSCLFLFSFVSGNSFFNKEPPSRTLAQRTVTKRQYRAPRALLDVCIYIDANVIADASILGLPLDALANLEICLCLSALPLFLETNIQGKVLVDLLGQNIATEILTLLINSANGKTCNYPPHSHSLCEADDPCGFTCDQPYVRQGTECVCPLPNTECNGVCGSFPQGCGSVVPRSLRRNNIRSVDGVITLQEAQSQCKSQDIVCGVYDSNTGFDCVDAKKNLESCGGCIVKHPFSGAQPPKGTDCTNIPNTAGVSCVAGRCIISSCKDGYSLNASGDSCSLFSGGPQVAQEVISASDSRMRGQKASVHRKTRRALLDSTTDVFAKDVIDLNNLGLGSSDTDVVSSIPLILKHRAFSSTALNADILSAGQKVVESALTLNLHSSPILSAASPDTILINISLSLSTATRTVALLAAATTIDDVSLNVKAILDISVKLNALLNGNDNDALIATVANLLVDLDALVKACDSLLAALSTSSSAPPTGSSPSPPSNNPGYPVSAGLIIDTSALLKVLGLSSVDDLYTDLNVDNLVGALNALLTGLGLSIGSTPSPASSPVPPSQSSGIDLGALVSTILNATANVIIDGNSLISTCDCSPQDPSPSESDPTTKLVVGLVEYLNALLNSTYALADVDSCGDAVTLLESLLSISSDIKVYLSSNTGVLSGNGGLSPYIAALLANVNVVVDSTGKLHDELNAGCGGSTDLLTALLSGLLGLTRTTLTL